MGDGDLREQIARLEADIEKLGEIVERCRKLIVISKAAIAVGGALILAMMVRFIGSDPILVIGAITSVIGGIVVFGSNTSTRRETEAAMKSAEAARDALIDEIDPRVVGNGNNYES